LTVPNQNRRRDVRVPTNLDARVTWDAIAYAARCTSLSLGGMFVETDLKLEYGSPAEVELVVYEASSNLRVKGIVRWSNARGFGLQLLPMGAADTHELLAVIERWKRG
jgi:hypothetical protein